MRREPAPASGIPARMPLGDRGRAAALLAAALLAAGPVIVAPVTATLLITASAGAQEPAPVPPRATEPAAPPASRWGTLYRFASDSADRLRQAQLRGASSTGFLLRSPSSMTAPIGLADRRSVAWRPLVPAATVVLNSAVPVSMHDGPLWSGVGASLRLAAGVEARWGRLRLIAAPELLLVGNASYQLADTGTVLAPSIPKDRSVYSSPWHLSPSSIDLPLRFGDDRVHRLDPGQSSLTVTLAALELGVATENQWWGPAIQNALLLSDHAGGFPHLFVRTARPVATPLGHVELRYLLGGLSESAFFDTVSANDHRAYAALAATLRPRGADGLIVGMARAVYATVDGWNGILGHALDPLVHVADPGAAGDGAPAGTREQLLSVFSRLVLPASGFEAYAELGRSAFPRSVRDLLVSPAHSRGHTFGVQWIGEPTRAKARLRLQAEYTNVERSASRAYRQVGSFYTSARVPQGYTQRGQPLGAAVGPGGSGQWLAADLVHRDWSAGVVLTRVRWNNDAHNERPWDVDEGWCEHDVSLLPGVRGSARGRYGVVSGRLFLGRRMNVFFDNGGWCPNTPYPRDESSASLSLTFQPAW